MFFSNNDRIKPIKFKMKNYNQDLIKDERELRKSEFKGEMEKTEFTERITISPSLNKLTGLESIFKK